MKSPSSLLTFVVSALLFKTSFAIILTDANQLWISTYDYVIIGAGTAGLALAGRLTEDRKISVLVLEAGGDDEDVIPVMAPFLGPSLSPKTIYDWNYTVVPQVGLDNREFNYPCGRLLGGSSSSNYMVHQYGSNENWDKMADISMDAGWGWNNMRKYIERHENFRPPIDHHNTTGEFDPLLHSYNGTLDISLHVGNQSIDTLVIETTKQLPHEFPYNKDMGGIDANLLGIGWAQSSMGSGERASSSTSYLAHANIRPNLTILINALVTKIVHTGSEGGLLSFRTVEYADSRNSESQARLRVHARKEVILSAGSVGTPKILQLSGIGNVADLTPFDIPVLIDSPEVGRNLQDHPLLPNIFMVRDDAPTLDSILRNGSAVAAAIEEWRKHRTGFVTNNVINNLGFARMPDHALRGGFDPSPGPGSPHYEMIFANYWLDPINDRPETGNFFTILTALLTPTSRGTVIINSTDPFEKPLINPSMLTTEFDVGVMRESVRAIKRFASAPAWDDYTIGSYRGLYAQSDAEIDAYVRKYTSTVFHPTSTAIMSSYASSGGVTNPDLTVKGTLGLRVVDLSVMPFVPSSHPQGPAYLIAERAADIIMGNDMHPQDDLSPRYMLAEL